MEAAIILVGTTAAEVETLATTSTLPCLKGTRWRIAARTEDMTINQKTVRNSLDIARGNITKILMESSGPLPELQGVVNCNGATDLALNFRRC